MWVLVLCSPKGAHKWLSEMKGPRRLHVDQRERVTCKVLLEQRPDTDEGLYKVSGTLLRRLGLLWLPCRAVLRHVLLDERLVLKAYMIVSATGSIEAADTERHKYAANVHVRPT